MDTKRFYSLVAAASDLSKSHYGDVSVGPDQLEKCTIGMAKLLYPLLATGGIPPFGGIAEAYVRLTGDTNMRGVYAPDKVPKDLTLRAGYNSASFTFALGDAMNIFVSELYKEFPYHEEILISRKRNVINFRKIHLVEFGYFGELPNVDPEAADYPDMEPFEDGETQYEISQKGAIIWVTRHMIVNDSVDVIQAMTKRLSRAARQAHSKYVWSFYANNANCPDGTPWFTTDHGNLGSEALDINPLATAITALANMTEAGPSGEKLGLDLATFNWHLVVPIAQWDTAVKKNQGEPAFTNPCQKLFGDHNERIVTCPFLTDANDWGVIRDREDVSIVEMSYLNGNEVPELIVERAPAAPGAYTFNNDRLGYKMRHEYGGVLAGRQGGYKSIVAE